MLILILAVVAILAFVGVYAYKSTQVGNQEARKEEKLEVEDEKLEDEEINDEEEELLDDTQDVENQEDGTPDVDIIIEDDLTPSL